MDMCPLTPVPSQSGATRGVRRSSPHVFILNICNNITPDRDVLLPPSCLPQDMHLKKKPNRGKYAQHHIGPFHRQCSSSQIPRTESITVAINIMPLYPFEAREEQVNELYTTIAIYHSKEDLILVARTSFGKSLVVRMPDTVMSNFRISHPSTSCAGFRAN